MPLQAIAKKLFLCWK